MENKTIETSKGTFKVRYAFDNNGVITLVIDTIESLFEGKFGDEIPYTSEYIKKYSVKIPKNFKV